MALEISGQPGSSATGAKPVHSRPNVLVVDDDEMIRRFVFKAGAHFGWQVGLAGNGLEAARLLKDTRWDVLLTDMIMPGMDGVELIRTAARGRQAPVIVAMTGGGDFNIDYLHIAQLIGARLVLRKPFALHQLAEIVREAITRAA